MPQSIDRNTIIRGPGSCLYNNTVELHATDAINANWKPTLWRPKSATHGDGKARIVDTTAEITFTPKGKITADLLNTFFPAQIRNPVLGQRLFGTTDKTLLIHALNGHKVLFSNATVLTPPELTLSAGASVYGPVTFIAVVKNNTARNATGAFLTYPTAADWAYNVIDDSFACPYTATWGATEILTEKPWKIKATVTAEPIFVEGVGIVDYEITAVSMQATCTPVAMSVETLVAAMQSASFTPGAIYSEGNTLALRGLTGGISLDMFEAEIISGPAQWAQNTNRIGEITFQSCRELVEDAENQTTTTGPLFDIGIV